MADSKEIDQKVIDLISEKPALEPAYKRLLKISPGPAEALQLLSLGYRSAHQLANRSVDDFVREFINTDPNNQVRTAQRIHQNATAIKTSVLLQWNYLRDLYSPHFKQIHRQRQPQMLSTAQQRASSLMPTASEEAAVTGTSSSASALPNYENLFPGNLLCTSDTGLSMYSPSAYMVDIMQVIQENITEQNPNIPPALTLQGRRPDLWTIPLDTENTQTPIRNIDLLLEVIESSLSEEGEPPVYEQLEEAVYPFNLPFNYFDAVTFLYLAYLNTNLATIKKTMLAANSKDTSWKLATLQLNSKLQELVETDHSTEIALYYGFEGEKDFQQASIATAANGSLANPYAFALADFGAWTGLSFLQVEQLVAQGLSPKELNAQVNNRFYINQGDTNLAPATLSKVYIPLEHTAIALPNQYAYIFFNSPYAANYGGPGYYPALTMGMWIKVDHLASGDTIVLRMGSQTWDYEHQEMLGLVINNKNQAYFGTLTANIDYDQNGFDFTDYVGRWIYFSGQLDPLSDPSYGQRNMRITAFVNGIKQTQVDGLLRVRSSSNISIGGNLTPREPNSNLTSFTGYIGEVKTLRFWDKLLTNSEINRSMYDLNTVSFPPDYQWNMQEGCGTTIDIEPATTHSDKYDGTGTFYGNPFWLLDGLLNITDVRLDRISRFVRLANNLGVSFADLDTLLYSLKVGKEDDALSKANLPYLGNAISLLRQYNIAADALSSLWYEMKNYGKKDEAHPQDLFDRVYNNPTEGFSGINFDSNQQTDWIIEREYNSEDPQNEAITAQLSASLNLGRSDLFTVVAFISGSTPQTSYTLTLNLDNFTLLYRYALLSQLTRLQIPELCSLIELERDAIKTAVNTADYGKDGIAIIQSLIDTAAWIVRSGINFQEFIQLVNDAESPNLYAISQAGRKLKIIDMVAQFNTQIIPQLVTPESFQDDAINSQLSHILFKEFKNADCVNEQGFIQTNYQQSQDPGFTGTVRQVPTDYQTIQSAIDNADDGDVILVDVKTDGTAYSGEGNTNIVIDKKLLIKSAQGPVNTMIDGEYAARAFLPKTDGIVIDGFSLINGLAKDNDGGGAIVSNNGITIRNCIFENNHSITADGGALATSGANLLTLQNCIFAMNKAGDSAHPANNGGAIATTSALTIDSCTFWKNETTQKGGAAYINTKQQVIITNCIFWDDNAPTPEDNGNEIYWNAAATDSSISYSSIEGYKGNHEQGNDPERNDAFGDSFPNIKEITTSSVITADPEFADTSTLRLIPSADSDCRAGHSSELAKDITGSVPQWLLEPFYKGQTGVVASVTKDYFDIDITLTEVITSYFFLKELESEQTVQDLLPTDTENLNQLPEMHHYAYVAKSFAFNPVELSTWCYFPEVLTGLATPDYFTLNTLEGLNQYRALTIAFEDESNKLITFWKYFSSDEDNNISALAQITRWAADDINYLTASIPTTNRFTYSNAVELFQLKACFDLLATSGIPIDSLYQTAGQVDFSEDMTGNLANLVKLNHESDWKQVSKELSGNISVLKRNALVPYAMIQFNSDDFPVTTEDALYAYLLLDPQMGSCDITSRITQATLSLQLYIHRCRMNLEPYVTDTKISDAYWEWLSNYRVWEANRKVFLYPENYLEPNLRKGKTPLFKQLEDGLLQTDITEQNVEKAYREYLNEFAKVSNLNIVGSYLFDATTEGVISAGRDDLVNSMIEFKKGTTALNIDPIGITRFNTMLRGAFSIDFLFLCQKNYSGTSPINIQDYQSKANPDSSWSVQLLNNNIIAVTTYDTTNSYTLKTSQGITINQWHQLSVVKSSADTYAQLYLDGKVVETTKSTAKATINTDVSFYVGEKSTILDYAFALAELRIWNKEYFPNDKGEIRESIFHRLSETYYKNNNSNDLLIYWMFVPEKRMIYTTLSYPSTSYVYFFDEVINSSLTAISGSTSNFPALNTTFSPIITPRIDKENEEDNYTIYFIGVDPTAKNGNFYYRSVRNMITWTPWKKIETDAPSVYNNKMLPVFAFNKLFRFWLQFDIQPRKDVQNVDLTVTLYYSYLSFNDTWTVPVNLRKVIKENIAPDTVYTQYDIAVYYDVANEQILAQILLQSGNKNVTLLTRDLSVFQFDSLTVAGRNTNVKISGSTLTNNTTTLLNNIYGNLQNAIVASSNISSSCTPVGNTANWMILNNGFQTLLIAPTSDMKHPKTMAANAAVSIASSTKAITYTTSPYVPQSSDSFTYWRLTTSAVNNLNSKFNAHSIGGLMSYDAQTSAEYSFLELEPSTTCLSKPIPTEVIDFSLQSPMSLYYWETFYYSAALIASQLNTNLKYNESRHWLEYIFNPTEKEGNPFPGPSSYWRFQGFGTPHNLLNNLQRNAKLQLAVYHEDPFDPYAIAWLRPTAFMKNTVMNYIDNLINYGDQQYRLNTRESINYAVLLYNLASDILGPKPQFSACGLHKSETYAEMQASYPEGNIPEFLIRLEDSSGLASVPGQVNDPSALSFSNYPYYFSIPENRKLLGYWDTIHQRLNNIRSCRSIDGVLQNLPLFEPPLNPTQWVGTSTNGSLEAALNNPAKEILPYRFSFVIEKAKNLAQSVIQFGNALLSAIEKKDAEHLAQLRATQETNILNMTRQIKIDQINEQLQQIKALQLTETITKTKTDYYTNLIDEGLSDSEIANLSLHAAGLTLQGISGGVRTAATPVYLLPTIFGMAVGGSNPGEAISKIATGLEVLSSMSYQSAGMAATIGQFQRRDQEWEFQKQMSLLEQQQVAAQIGAADERLSALNQEYNILMVQIQQSNEIQAFLSDKFTNAQLYQWMVSRLSAIYFMSYQLAFEFSRLAEKSYQYERCSYKTFISPGNWNNLYQGLLAGEGLLMELNHMDSEYVHKDVRRLEIQKTISLKQVDLKAFERFVIEGTCDFSLRETDFDEDYPGHYQRLINSMAISIPVVIGPYQNLHATLTQLSNKVVLAPDINTVNYLSGKSSSIPQPDTLRQDWRAQQQIAISRGINDSGLFELNFNDARYLPFEGTGAISDWRLEMPKQNNKIIKYETITDVIITLNYTALSGGATFINNVKGAIGSVGL